MLAGRKVRAAELVAQDTLTDTRIAQSLGVAQMTLERWKRAPEFQAEVARIQEELRAAIRAEGIAHRQNRIDALNNRWNLMQQVIQARADANVRRNVQLDEGGTAEGFSFDDYWSTASPT
jgi:transposase-like protein